MKSFEMIRFGLRSLWRYKLRSSLTMLGIICGIAAVITMMAIGKGAEEEILKVTNVMEKIMIKMAK